AKEVLDPAGRHRACPGNNFACVYAGIRDRAVHIHAVLDRRATRVVLRSPMSTRLSVKFAFAAILSVITFALCEVGFRVYDRVTTPKELGNVDDAIKKLSRELEPHASLGYRRIPNTAVDERTQVDQFGMVNDRLAVASNTADVVGVGDSFME